MTFVGHSRSGMTSSHMSVIEVSSSRISEVSGETKLSENSQQRQNKIEHQELRIGSLEAQNLKLRQPLKPNFLVNAIILVMPSILNIAQGKKPTSSSSGSTHTGNPYLGKPHSYHLVPGKDGSLDPDCLGSIERISATLNKIVSNLTGSWPLRREKLKRKWSVIKTQQILLVDHQ